MAFSDQLRRKLDLVGGSVVFSPLEKMPNRDEYKFPNSED